MNHPEATAAALGILRNPATFQYLVTICASRFCEDCATDQSASEVHRATTQ